LGIIVPAVDTVEKAEAADQIAAVAGIDVIFAASSDLASFSGHRQGLPAYQALVTKVHDAVLNAGKKLGGPPSWHDRAGFTFFQCPTETALINNGVSLSWSRPHPRSLRRPALACAV